MAKVNPSVPRPASAPLTAGRGCRRYGRLYRRLPVECAAGGDPTRWRSFALVAARHVGGARLSGPLDVARAAGPSQEGAVAL